MTDLAARYGRRGKRRWPAYVAGTIAVVLLGWLIWAIWMQSTPKVTSGLVHFTIPSDVEATAELQVHRSSADVVATCVLRALGEDHGTVGETSFQVTGTTLKLDTTQSVRTIRRAFAVTLVGCTAPGQDRPR